MRHGIALWNFARPGVSLAELIDRFAAMGFEAMSFLPRQLLGMTAREQRELSSLLRRRALTATVHGAFDLGPEDVERVVSVLARRLQSFTFDAAKRDDSSGGAFDAERMAPLLRHVERCSRGTSLRFGVEDFPLDGQTLHRFGGALAALAQCPRFGVLIDVGHMNLALRREGRKVPRSIADYIAAVPLPIIEVHLHDNDGTRDSHAPLGSGGIGFDRVAIALREAGFAGVATIEIAPALYGCPAEEAMRHAGESLAAWRRAWARAGRHGGT
jgi:sugar phosphate isomerase/epimerase